MNINQERINSLMKSLSQKHLKHFVKEVQIFGLQNLKKLKDKQILYLPNHLSHFDYILIPKILNDIKLNHPATIAGANLDIWPINKIICEQTGAVFIDRKIMKMEEINKEKRKEITKLNSALEELITRDQSLVNFVESGRNYSGKVMERGDSGILSRYLKFAKKQKKAPYACNIAIKYDPHTIESPCLHIASFFKNKIELAYLFTDVYAFGKNYILPTEKKPIVKINFGEPYSLENFIETRNHEELLRFVQEDVKRLFGEIY